MIIKNILVSPRKLRFINYEQVLQLHSTLLYPTALDSTSTPIWPLSTPVLSPSLHFLTQFAQHIEWLWFKTHVQAKPFSRSFVRSPRATPFQFFSGW